MHSNVRLVIDIRNRCFNIQLNINVIAIWLTTMVGLILTLQN